MKITKKQKKLIERIEKDNNLMIRFKELTKTHKTITNILPIIFPEEYEHSKYFLKTQKWRLLRYKALKQSNGRCCLCGRSAKDGVVLHVDHIIPISKDPSKKLDINNLQVLCEDCNFGKSNKDYTDWR